MATHSKAVVDQAGDAHFLDLLYRGGELLAAGKPIEAREVLEKAFALQPKNAKGQNLLGLTYFKLGLFDRAGELYESLVRENPIDPTLRVNLGLVYLKTQSLQRAIRELETAVDLSPEHQKAQNYLGLALAQVGEYGRARECFVAAGSTGMAEKMRRALAGEPLSRSEAPAPGRERGFAEIDAQEMVQAIEPAGAPKAAESSAGPSPGAPVAAPQGEASVVRGTALGTGFRIAGFEGSPFEVEGGVVRVRVVSEMLTRVEGLVVCAGSLTLTPAMKRFRGRATDKPFGEGERRFVRVTGQGTLVLSGGKRHHLSVEIGEESVYFKEDVVIAFEESVSFENGRVPSRIAPDLHLVHMRGPGKLLLGVAGPIGSEPVKGDRPVCVTFDGLVGWHGNLTPKIVPVAQEGEAAPLFAAVELTGEGLAFFTSRGAS